MPYAMSDMVAATVPEDYFSDSLGPRIYLTGGCISDQVCSYFNETTDNIFCYCTNVTDKMIYFQPETHTYHSAATMLRPRYRHMGKCLLFNFVMSIY
jgi:hypothetical protein